MEMIEAPDMPAQQKLAVMIDSDLRRRCKIAALQDGKSFRQFVEEALRAAVADRREDR